MENNIDYKELYIRERSYTKICLIALFALSIFMVFLAIKYSGTSVEVDSHIEKVDIQDLRLLDGAIEDTIIVDFITPDTNEYNLSYTTPDKSVDVLSNIINDWNDESKYVVFDYDIITKYSYNIFTDKINVNTKVVIRNSAAYLKK